MAKAFINDENLTDIADAIRATLDESRQYLPSEMAGAIDGIPIMAQLKRKKYFQSVPAGAASGYATIERIEGNTVAWNQLVENGDFVTNGQWSTAVGGTMTIDTANNKAVFTAGANVSTTSRIRKSLSIPANHVFYTAFSVFSSKSNTMFLKLDNGTISIPVNNYETPNVWRRLSFVGTNSTPGTYLYGYINGSQSLVANDTVEIKNVVLMDLTQMFGAGNEPTTVADFEAWIEQNIGTLPYYDYNAGELISLKMSGMQTEDSSQQTVDTMTLDVTTITGINTATNVRETIFPQGMKQADRAGTVKDILDLRNDTATVDVGSRAYQSGDESDTSVITDGTTTYYALTTPMEYTDLQDGNGNPLNPRYKVEQGGTEQVLPVNTSTPTTVASTLSTIYKKNI